MPAVSGSAGRVVPGRATDEGLMLEEHDVGESPSGDDGRLLSRPLSLDAHEPFPGPPSGLVPLGLGDRRDGVLYVPGTYRPGVGAPLSVKLHGAGGDGSGGLRPFLPFAEASGALLLGIDARGPTWDVIRGGFGPDIAFLDLALERVFGRFSVDPSRVSIEGFSDGASYALSVGLTNGDLFSRIVAFSPGFMAPGECRGRPGIFVSHGVRDDVLPINRCSRRIVPRLRGDEYTVDYREFFGGHTVPESIARDAEAWATGRQVEPER
jgi:phospholipase/carboxylesterase